MTHSRSRANEHALIDLDELSDVLGALPHCRALGLRVEEIGRDRARMVLPAGPHLAGDREGGEMHAGAVLTLIDTLCGLVAFTGVAAGTSVATLDLRVDSLTPPRADADLVAEAECTARTGAVAYVQARVFQAPDPAPVATAASTFMTGSVGFTVQGRPPWP